MHSLQKLHLEISITWVKVHQLALPQAKSKTNRTSILGFTASFNYYYIQIWLIFKRRNNFKEVTDNVPSSKIDSKFVNKNVPYDLEKNTLGKIPETISENRMWDHRLLKTLFKKNVNKRRNDYWKLNNPH